MFSERLRRNLIFSFAVAHSRDRTGYGASVDVCRTL